MTVHLISYGQGAPVVFFHGWGFDSSVWAPIVSELQTKYTLILVDLPGFGKSPLKEWEQFKTSLLNTLPARFSLAGWSLGGLFATRLAIEAPERVVRLLNITSSPRFINEEKWPGIDGAVFEQFNHKLSTDLPKALRDFVALQSNNKLEDYTQNTQPSLQGLSSGLGILETWDLRKDLHTLSIPTCYLFGRLDPITPARTMKAMQRLYPQFNYLLFNKSAHMPFLSHTQEFIAEFTGFIPCNDILF